jgi:deoxyribonucleoside regulator
MSSVICHFRLVICQLLLKTPFHDMKKSSPSLSTTSMQSTLVQVARFYYEEGLSQQEIATRLGVSRSLIALYLQNARDMGIVRIQVIDPTHSCTDLATELKKKTGVKHITVIPNPRGAQTLSMRAVAGAAAEHITGNLKSGNALGLAWGRTTTMVASLFDTTRARRVDVLPLMGESGHAVLHSQMNQLVMQSAQTLGAKAYFLSLPMIVSSAQLRNDLANETSIREVIDRWDGIDIACLGVGVTPPVPGMVVYIGDEHLPQLINKGAVGDMCGIYYDRDGQIIKTGFEDRTIAIRAEQLKAVRSVVAVAWGEDKAVAVLGALRTGMVSDLFIDQDMAEQIIQELDTPTSLKP